MCQKRGRLCGKLAIEQAPTLLLRWFVPDFAQKEEAASLIGYNRYWLDDEIRDPVTGETVIFFPDAAFILQSATSDAARLFFLEVDRGTEGPETTSPKRAGNMVRLVQETVCHATVLVTDHRQVTPSSVLQGTIWRDKDGKVKSLVQPKKLAMLMLHDKMTELNLHLHGSQSCGRLRLSPGH